MQKTARKKKQIFENGQKTARKKKNLKMVILSQKLKMSKTCEKPFYKNITVVLCKKQLEKITNIRDVKEFGKSAILQRL